MYMGVLLECMSVYRVQTVLQRPEENIKSSEVETIWVLEIEAELLEEQPVL